MSMYIESARKMRRRSSLVGRATKKPWVRLAGSGSPSLAEGQLWVYKLVISGHKGAVI